MYNGRVEYGRGKRKCLFYGEASGKVWAGQGRAARRNSTKKFHQEVPPRNSHLVLVLVLVWFWVESAGLTVVWMGKNGHCALAEK